MSKLAFLHPVDINLVENGHADVSELIWSSSTMGEIPLKRMDDAHLKNALMSLIGMGKTTYEAPNELKELWIKALRLEWEKRMSERRAKFSR